MSVTSNSAITTKILGKHRNRLKPNQMNRSLSNNVMHKNSNWKSLSSTFSSLHKANKNSKSGRNSFPKLASTASIVNFDDNAIVTKKRSKSNMSNNSLGSKEQYYYRKQKSVNNHALMNSASLTSTHNIQHEFTSAKSEQNWRYALRKSHPTFAYVSKERMKFGTKKTKHTTNKFYNKTKIQGLNAHETKLLNLKTQKWFASRGFKKKVYNPVTQDQFHLYYEAFNAIAKRKGSNGLQQISANDIYHIAKELGISTNPKETEKVTNIIDTNGSQKITFGEMVHTIEDLAKNDQLPFIGGQMTLDMMLLHYSRQQTMNAIFSTVNHESKCTPPTSDLYFRHRRNFKAETRSINLCHLCFRKVKYEHELHNHLLNDHEYDGDYFTCYECGEEWIPISKKSSHIAQHRSLVEQKAGFRCNYCQAVFRSGDTLAYHVSEKHTPLKLDIFKCSKCHETFSTKPQLQTHELELHTKKKNIKQSGSQGVVSKILPKTTDDFEEMKPSEFRQIQADFLSSPTRNGLNNRVNHLRTIQMLRHQNSEKKLAVEVLKPLFDKQDQLLQEQKDKRRTMDVLTFLNEHK